MEFETSFGSLSWCSITFITALLHMQHMFTISNLFLNKGTQHTELSLERHTKPLTICRAILTFIFSPLRRTFSRLTNSSASFRDSSCNKKTHQQWTCYCTLSTVKSAASQHPHGVKRMVVQDRLILQTPYNALLKVRTVIVAKQNSKQKFHLCRRDFQKEEEKRYNAMFLL